MASCSLLLVMVSSKRAEAALTLDGNVILWVPSDRPNVTFGETPEELPDKEHWRPQKMLQVTNKHVMDLAWSPDGEFFIAGSTDNTATIWKASTGR